jgi:tRNA(Ile)-lysidine synthase
MRLPLVVASAIRSRRLIEPEQRVLIALSGGPDSVALLHCMLELSKKRDLKFELCAAHLNHGLRGKEADEDEKFSRQLCRKRGIPLVSAYSDIGKTAQAIKRSHEETGRIVRRAFLARACLLLKASCVAVAHHADDRIETVLYRLCRGTGLAGLQGIGWVGPLRLEGEPSVDEFIEWHSVSAARPASTLERQYYAKERKKALAESGDPLLDVQVVRPMLACSRPEILAYLRTKHQRYRTDQTNFDTDIPRNAIRGIVLPALCGKVHPGTRQALWRLAEEAEVHAEKRLWRRDWMTAFAKLGASDSLSLTVPKLGSPPEIDELRDALDVLSSIWVLSGVQFTQRHALALRRLFVWTSGPKTLDLPGNLSAERRAKTVLIRRNFRARDLL